MMDRRSWLLGVTSAALLNPATIARAVAQPVRAFEPYTIDFGPDLVADLHARLDRVRWADIPFASGWSAGTDDQTLRDLVRYWREDYDWFAVQRQLNSLEHLRGPIENDPLHLIRVRSPGDGPKMPLLLIHGWPSSFVEFLSAARRLTAPGTGFELIIPSLPGFALSAAPSEPGVGYDRIAQRLHQMMTELGYARYGVQGGDWGALIGTQIARRYPDSVVGLHLNFVAVAPPPPGGTEPSPAEIEYRQMRERFQAEETGYSSIQGTRPQTLAYAQADSPVGLLAWILEKYWAWGDHRGDLWSAFDRDSVLTTAMLYWLPNRILSAARIYYETRQQTGAPGGRVEVPTAYARFPAEPWSPPPEVVGRSYNLVRFNEFARGGHFPAWEQPEPWSADVAEFFSRLAP